MGVRIVLSAVLLAVTMQITVCADTAAQGPGGSMMGPGYGMMGPGTGPMGPGYGPMGPGYGMMGPGYGMMGPGYGMMGPGFWMMGPGYGMMGPGYGMMGPGMMGPGWGYGMGGPAEKELSADDVRAWLERSLAWQGNKRLKVGSVTEKDDDTILADIVTVDDSLVQRLAIDRHTGWSRQVE